MQFEGDLAGETPPRVCVVSLREMEAHVARAGGYEFEDIIARDLDDARILSPRHAGWSPRRLSLHRWLSRRTALAQRLSPGLQVPALDRDVDLLFISAAQLWDISALASVKDWRRRSRVAICWLQELWMADIPRNGPLIEALNAFDHVICPFHHSAEPLRQRLDVPVTYLPWGIDALGFCPWPDPPARVIDAYNIGGISGVTHDAMVAHAAATGRFYLHDTTKGRRTVASHVAHRQNYGATLKRTKYFFSHKAKVLRPGERGAQEEFGLRYLEGTAAGAILLGDRVDNPAFHEHLGWPDAVIQIPYDCPDIGAVIEDLESQPARIAAARRANVLNALRHHDHLHRWDRVLDLAGLAPSPKMQARRAALEARAAQVEAQIEAGDEAAGSGQEASGQGDAARDHRTATA